MLVLAIAALIALAAGAWLYMRNRAALPSGWTAITDGKDYGTKVDAAGSFAFPQAPDSVHYVTEACSSLAGKAAIRLRYRIDADPAVRFIPSSDPRPGVPAIGPTIYLQRKGDDWSGAGAFETYRWWATFAAPMPITAGEHEIVAPLDGRWTAVASSNSIDSRKAFLEVLANAGRIGFTFGGGTGFGHGVFATGAARFTLIALEIVASSPNPATAR